MTGDPILCTVCGQDRFCAARKLQHLNLADGTNNRAWTTGLEDAGVILCVNCHTHYVWNAVTLVYDQAPPFVHAHA